jgi:hypothetical protein
MKIKIVKKRLCSSCKVGKDSYKIDKRSLFCPYLIYHNGKACAFYKSITEEDGKGSKKKLFSVAKK